MRAEGAPLGRRLPRLDLQRDAHGRRPTAGRFPAGVLPEEQIDMSRREIWSFFTGAMGLDLGLERAGLNATLAVEKHPVFCGTIRKNRPALMLLEADVCVLKARDLLAARRSPKEVFLLVGGPPCQSSPAGSVLAVGPERKPDLRVPPADRRGKAEVFRYGERGEHRDGVLWHRPISGRPGKHWSLKRYSDPVFNGGSDVPPLEEDELASSAIRQVLSDVRGLRYDVVFGVWTPPSLAPRKNGCVS